mgnify:CR=1 FL=1
MIISILGLWNFELALANSLITTPFQTDTSFSTGRFTRLSANDTGIAFENKLRPEHIKNYLLLGAGVTVGDYDDDGLPDIFLCSQDGPNKLFRQTSAWQFEDVTKAAGISHQQGWSAGAAFADVDNDGDLDLFVCNKGNHNELYRNQGNGTFKGGFVQQSDPSNAAPTMPAFSDYDRDGDLDLYLTRTRLLSLQERFGYKIGLIQNEAGDWKPHPKYGDEFEVIAKTPRELGGHDQLFENTGLTETGIPRLVDVTKKSGIIQTREHGLAAVWWDANNDDWPDLYVSNDFHTPDHLYLNQQDGTFTEVTTEVIPYTSWSSMGSDFADINNDGFLDYLSTDMSATTHFKQKTMMGAMIDTAWFLDNLEPRQYMRNVMLVNTGTGPFLECAQFAGIDSTDWTWSAIFGDLDNDGWEDVFFTNGIERNVNDSDLSIRMNALKKQGASFAEIQREMVDTPRHTEKNLAFKNNRDLTFLDMSSAWELDLDSVSHGAVFADLDRDGDLDLVVNNMNDPVAIYRNDISNSSSSLLIQLRGTKSNRFGLGARVVAKTSHGQHTRIVTSSRGYMSGAEPLAHIGLGDTEVLESLEIHWPSGTLQSFRQVKAGQLLTITEPNTSSKPTLSKNTTPLFTDFGAKSGIDFTHHENDYDDFADQPLLPNRLSRFGPALAAGDCNGDGLDDLYLGGAASQAGAFYLQQSKGSFKAVPFPSEPLHEDTDATFFDADGDGDLDLYVVSGGASAPARDPHYRDRLYMNDGKGAFVKAINNAMPLIDSSGSCVAAADFDKDGDQDLFVGSRFVPKNYPNASSSILLINGSKPQIKTLDLGLVTAATWVDVNGDTWLDLLVTTEWGSPTLLLNQEGRLQGATARAGLIGYTGWWNGLAAADIDHDGDVDFVASNVGLNTKYQASAEKPVLLYAGDFVGDGTLRLIEATTKEGRILPVRGKSCSTHAMPHLASRFPTYRSFANATLTEIYTPDRLQRALELKATTLASMVFINDGKGHFKGQPLPPLAQLAPGFGIILQDLDGDKHLDCVMAQNFYHPQRETGRMNASLNVILKGNGKGSFQAMWPKESGLIYRDDSRGAIMLDQSTLVIGVNDGAPRVLKLN